MLSVLGGPGGKVAEVKILKRSGSNALDQAARKAVKNGACNASVWTEFRVPVSFTLE